MYVDGGNYRRIARTLGVSHQSVVNWVNDATKRVHPEATPRPPMGADDVVELDELFTFVGDKKTRSTSSRKSIGTRAVS